MLDFSKLKSLTFDGIKLKNLVIEGTQIWKSGFKNWVLFSINADGSIYNNGLGYKNGYRVRSGGAEVATVGASCTGYIPTKAGDIIRLSGYNALAQNVGASNAINVSDADFKNLGQAASNGSYGIIADKYFPAYGWGSVVEGPAGVYSWIVPPDASIAYIRVTGAIENGAQMIITINEEIN